MIHVSRETKKTIVVILGPTASGKTQFAISLAKSIDGEIISVDSRQVYKRMNIGTGKELKKYGDIKVHLIDIVEPWEPFSVADFQKVAREQIYEILKKNKIPILCGGTGFYVKALLEEYDFDPYPSNIEYTRQLESLSREKLEDKIKRLGIWESHHWEEDSKRRMARAIEKKTISSIKNKKMTAIYNIYFYYIEKKTEELRVNIKQRLESRLQQGMIQEVESLLKEEKINHELLQQFGLEYKWISLFLQNKITYEYMKQKLYTEICRYAKRQRTFIRYLKKQGYSFETITNVKNALEKIKKKLDLTDEQN